MNFGSSGRGFLGVEGARGGEGLRGLPLVIGAAVAPSPPHSFTPHYLTPSTPHPLNNSNPISNVTQSMKHLHMQYTLQFIIGLLLAAGSMGAQEVGSIELRNPSF